MRQRFPKDLKKYHSNLLCWYKKNRRRLPWRETKDPYAIWISEIMLQQTQVKTVIPYYLKFLKRFPNVESLAQAPLHEVLSHWSGLGYYLRAKNIHRAAQNIVKQFAGQFPKTYEEIFKLPGIGRYSASAIASIALGKPCPVVDGNVLRVFARLFLIRQNAKLPSVQKYLWELAEKLLNKKQPGNWNQALMELGATLCLPENPKCGVCPLSKLCLARQKGMEKTLPHIAKNKKIISLCWETVFLKEDGRCLLHHRKNEPLLKNHWGLPLLSDLKLKNLELLGTIRHTITHHKILMKVYSANIINGKNFNTNTKREFRSNFNPDSPVKDPHTFPSPLGVGQGEGQQKSSWLSDVKIGPTEDSRFKWIAQKDLKKYLVSSLWKKALRLACAET